MIVDSEGCSPCVLAASQTRSRLFALSLLVLCITCFVAAHVLYLGQALTTTQALRQDVGVFTHPDHLLREHVRFPRTKRRLPQCIIVGARKCGTRALLEFLNIHTAIQKAADEVHFFDDDSKYMLGLEWYRRKMPYSFPGQVTVEKSPAYFVTESVPGRVWAMNSSILLLLIVRDPVVRLISDYAQLAANRQRRDKQVAAFHEVVLLPDGSVNTEYRPVRTSMYAVYFKRWLSQFPRHQIHVIDGDRLVKDPFPEMQKVETFLGLPHRIPKSAFYFNRTKGFYCVRNDTLEKCLNESKGRKHPEVSKKVISKLRHFYAPFNREFYRMVGKDFDWPEE